jgi:hypothetical protein
MTAPGCFRLERLPGGTYTHWNAPTFHGAHPDRSRFGRATCYLNDLTYWHLGRHGSSPPGIKSGLPLGIRLLLGVGARVDLGLEAVAFIQIE